MRGNMRDTQYRSLKLFLSLVNNFMEGGATAPVALLPQVRQCNSNKSLLRIHSRLSSFGKLFGQAVDACNLTHRVVGSTPTQKQLWVYTKCFRKILSGHTDAMNLKKNLLSVCIFPQQLLLQTALRQKVGQVACTPSPPQVWIQLRSTVIWTPAMVGGQ